MNESNIKIKHKRSRHPWPFSLWLIYQNIVIPIAFVYFKRSARYVQVECTQIFIHSLVMTGLREFIFQLHGICPRLSLSIQY